MDISWILDADDNMQKTSVRHTSKTMSKVKLQVGRLFAQIAYLPSEKQRVADGSKLASFFLRNPFFDSLANTNQHENNNKKKR